MTEATYDIGLIGLAVMGQNLVLNMDDHGIRVAVFNRTTSKMTEYIEQRAQGTNIYGATTLEELVSVLKRPRRVMMMIRAGDAVDEQIEALLPLLEPGDIIIDGGNSNYQDTMRRVAYVEGKGLLYIGTGVSGGEDGARFGPSIMPGGSPEAWPHVKHILQSISAKVEDGTPCCDWVGENGAGHYVKMVHNGIEYGDMQLIAEAYAVLQGALGLTAAELAEIFGQWNQGELDSFLIDITATIFKKIDGETGQPLVDLVLDKAAQKGTGKWTSQDAFDIGAPIPTINSAVVGRIISSLKEERVAASKVLPGPEQTVYDGDRDELIDMVRQALYASKISAYAQGMAMLRIASEEYGYELNLAEIASIWRAGCIIRARFLNRITEAFTRKPGLPNLLLDESLGQAVAERLPAWRKVVQIAIGLGIPVPAFSVSLAYYDSYRSARLPANLIQAQRDLFGAHTYERTDKAGFFHTDWES